jgi:hypothetical protein
MPRPRLSTVPFQTKQKNIIILGGIYGMDGKLVDALVIDGCACRLPTLESTLHPFLGFAFYVTWGSWYSNLELLI